MAGAKSIYRRICIVLYHSAAICASIAMAFVLRFEFLFPRGEMPHLIDSLFIALFIKSVVFRFMGLDRGSWRYASILDLRRILTANVVASLAFTLVTALVVGRNFPRSVYFGDFLICFLLTAGGQFGLRVYRETVRVPVSSKQQHRVLIYGAGQAGVMLLKETLGNPALGYRVVGFLDDNPNTVSMNVMGVRVLGSGRSAPAIVSRFAKRNEPLEAILIAMPSANGRQMGEALANCRAAGIACKTVPSIAEVINGKVSIHQMRDVSVEDLLGRNPVHIDEEAVRQFLQGKSVMVTGAGGSIGSELCRKIARFRPQKLVAFDQAESDLFRIQMEMNERQGCPFIPQIGDIRDMVRVQEVIRQHRVQCIFHAAAYKHVPMMEAHALEAIKNNVLGTRNLVEAAHLNGVSHFAMISSDKAVNPTNIMGLTKRIAELIVSSMPMRGGSVGTTFVSVRFGNVLGSNGSVVPLFRQQILAGGPVTVTHPEVKRYFMTIPEAVDLVLQASTMGKGSELFVLDMGQPVRIADLARNMIRLSGKDPDTEIEIRYTGLRPGEKLYEELMHEGEDILPTFHEKINIFRGSNAIERADMERTLRELEALVQRRDAAGAVGLLWRLAPEYTPDVTWKKILAETRLAAEASA